MKRYYFTTAILIAALITINTCTPLAFIDSGSTKVLINTGMDLARAAKSDVSSFKLTVSAADMETIEQSFTEQISELEIEAGSDRTFTLEALDTDKNVIFSGSNTLDLTAGNTTTVVIEMNYNGFYVVFNTNGADSISTQFLTSGSIITEPDKPVKTGYDFGGWFSDVDLLNAWTFEEDTVTEDTTLYAKWTPSVYSITYNLNEGTNHIENPASYTIESPAIPLSVPDRTGYIFDGWYTDEEMKASPITEIAAGSTGAVTVYAKWTTDGYSITYNLDGGSNHVDNPLSYTITTSTITLSSPTKTGYTFDGWFSDASLSSSITEISAGSTGNISVYAKWVIDSYSISYSLFGGINGANPTSYTIESSTITLANPDKTGYTFNGWYTDENLTSSITQIASGSTGNITVYAKWTVISYTITYNLNSGTNNDSNPDSYTIESSTITLTDPTRTSYTFNGWYSDSGFTTEVNEIAAGSTENITLYAKWTANTLTITYDDNGADDGSVPSSQAKKQGVDIILSSNTGNLSKTGYSFSGWNTEPSGSGTDYAEGSTYTIDSEITLYAKWTEEEYSITYNLNGGSETTNPTSYSITSSFTLSEDTNLQDWEFAGWYDNSSLTGEPVIYLANGRTGDLDLYARWVQIYSGTIDTDDETALNRGEGYYADYWAIGFSSDTTVTIEMNGQSGLGDTYLYLCLADENASDDSVSLTMLASDDDSGYGTNAQITYTLSAETIYYIEATTFSSGATGSYEIELSESPDGMYEITMYNPI